MTGSLLFRYISAFSIVIAVVIGFIRIRQLPDSYKPFFYLCLFAFLNEGLSTYLIKTYGTNTINNNIYVLLELFFIMYLFIVWESSVKKQRSYAVIFLVLFFIWIVDSLVIHSLKSYTSFYHLSYYLTLIFLSINYLSRIVLNERNNVLQNPRFLICTGFLIYFSFGALLEIFFVLKIDLTPEANFYLLSILRSVNLFINLLYAMALICIPTKQKSILLSSQGL